MEKRSGLILSVAAHAGLAAIVLSVFGGPRLFEASAERVITVDVMTPQEAAQEQGIDQQAPKTEQAASVSSGITASPAAKGAQSQESKPSEAQSETQVNDELPSIDAGQLLPTYNLRLPPEIDAGAVTAASLSPDEVLGLKAHLRKCWRLPAGVSANSGTRVVMRVPFRSTGGLAGEPTLVEASASRDGPAIMQAALAALTACAPYSFLPRDRYKEWRVLDVSFSPREMGG